MFNASFTMRASALALLAGGLALLFAPDDVSAIAMLKIAALPGASPLVGACAIVFTLFAALYGWLMFRAPTPAP
jgi:hypothetical protein